MTGRFTRKMYDRCASSQDLAQSTGPLELILDANKYVNCGNICRPLEQFSGDSASLVDVESSLWGIDKLASRCDEAKHPFCGPNGCMLTDDPRIPRHTPPFLCERGRLGDNAVVTTNMEMPTDVGYKIADPNICDVRNGYYFDPSKWAGSEAQAKAQAYRQAQQAQASAPTGDYAAWVQTHGPISDQLAPVMNARPQAQQQAQQQAPTGQLLANLDQIRATHQYSQDHGRRVVQPTSGTIPNRGQGQLNGQAQFNGQVRAQVQASGQQLLNNLGLAARGDGSRVQALGSQIRGIAPQGSMQRPDGSRVSSFAPRSLYDGTRQLPPRDGSRQLPSDWASRLPPRDGTYQLPRDGTYMPPRDGSRQLPPRDGTYQLPRDGTYMPPRDGSRQLPPRDGTYQLPRDGTYMPPRDGSRQLPPRDGTYQLPRDGTYQLPRDGTYMPPRDGSYQLPEGVQITGQRIQQVRDTRATGYPSETPTQMRPQLQQPIGPISRDGTYAQSIPMIGADGQLRAGLTQYAGNFARPEGSTPGQYLPPLRNQQTAPMPAPVPTSAPVPAPVPAPTPTTGSRGYSIPGAGTGQYRDQYQDQIQNIQGQAQTYADNRAASGQAPIDWNTIKSQYHLPTSMAGVENAVKGGLNRFNQQLGRLAK